jgi:AdoMet-dependent heme synthase
MSKSLPILGASDAGLAPVPAPRAPMSNGIQADTPTVPLAALDQLWFQVAGTVCNLRCSHCFISCSPENHSFWFLTREEVREALDESVGIGVKEYYFTGGEPFMNREMLGILEDTLALGPATVLTNATLIPERAARELARIADGSPYTLELRVSLDGTTAEMNDALRGTGSFERAMAGLGRLVRVGFLPIITTMQSWDDAETPEVLGAFRQALAAIGYDRPRLKILPPLLIGAEAERSRGYERTERVTPEMMVDYDEDLLLCARARLVTKKGVWACPILLDYESARLGGTLAEATAPAPLAEQACFTCYVSGAICSNSSGMTRDFS